MNHEPEVKELNPLKTTIGHKCDQAKPEGIIYQAEAQLEIACIPTEVYALVSDITRMGEWSPECRAGEWLDGADRPEVGVRFRGHNRWEAADFGWSKTAVITVAEPGQEFAFTTVFEPASPDTTHWCYRFEAVEGGTLVTEACQYVENQWPADMQSMLVSHQLTLQPGMQQTLERLKAYIETKS